MVSKLFIPLSDFHSDRLSLGGVLAPRLSLSLSSRLSDRSRWKLSLRSSRALLLSLSLKTCTKWDITWIPFPVNTVTVFIPYCIFHSYLPLESFGASSFWSAVSTKVVPVSPVTKRSISAVVSGVHGPVFSSVISLHFPVKGSGFTSIRHSIVSAIII